jgi:hypothetical protein
MLCFSVEGSSPVFENLPTRSVWVCGYVPSCLTLKRHCSLEARWLRRLPGTKRPPGREAGSVWPGGRTPSILWSWEKARYHSFLSLVLYRLVAPRL